MAPIGLSFPRDQCTPFGDQGIRVVEIVSGGENMFSVAPSDVLYGINEWDPLSNTILTFGMRVIEKGKCQVADFISDEEKYYKYYCQQGIIYVLEAASVY